MQQQQQKKLELHWNSRKRRSNWSIPLTDTNIDIKNRFKKPSHFFKKKMNLDEHCYTVLWVFQRYLFSCGWNKEQKKLNTEIFSIFTTTEKKKRQHCTTDHYHFKVLVTKKKEGNKTVTEIKNSKKKVDNRKIVFDFHSVFIGMNNKI